MCRTDKLFLFIFIPPLCYKAQETLQWLPPLLDPAPPPHQLIEVAVVGLPVNQSIDSNNFKEHTAPTPQPGLTRYRAHVHKRY